MKRLMIFFWLFILFSALPVLAANKNIDVPFTVQAPDGWYSPFDEACEEAAIVMLDNFYQGKNYIADPKKEILAVVSIENKLWGYNKDTDAHQMAHIINNFFAFETDTKNNSTLAAIKNEIDNNRPVLVPVYGRGLSNPNFRGAGPIYHVVIIKGYDDSTKEFIVNEPGTIHGHDWRYDFDEMMNAIHDLNYSNQQEGAKVVLFTHDDIRHSGWSDADKDGFSKSEEMKSGTDLKSALSFPGQNFAIYNNKILRSFTDPRVFLINNGHKSRIYSARELFAKGFDWRDLLRVEQNVLDLIPNQ
ncbi:MAG TPA: C39 family peptidase [Candidatus Bipolaricaulota bacterium]|nr:C39 family peptidase [Candidatus Bipolaricaulota bacterium]